MSEKAKCDQCGRPMCNMIDDACDTAPHVVCSEMCCYTGDYDCIQRQLATERAAREKAEKERDDLLCEKEANEQSSMTMAYKISELQQRAEKAEATLRRMIGWAENPPQPQEPGHSCGPEGNCDCDCMARAYYTADLAAARKLLEPR